MSRDAEHPVEYRDTDGISATKEEWDEIERVLVSRGWMSLNRQTTPRIALAEDDKGIAGFFIVQFVPHAGPMWTRPGLRGTKVPQMLVERMYRFLTECEARGIVVVADNPITAKMCETAQLKKVESPVYVFPGAEV